MRHLMSPLDFTVEELDKNIFRSLPMISKHIQTNMHMHVTGRSLPLSFMSQVPAQD